MGGARRCPQDRRPEHLDKTPVAIFVAMEADISGPQRKVIESNVVPVRLSHGETGVPLRRGRTLPFRVTRTWSAPAGVYFERFYLVDPETREVHLEGPEREVHVLGLQARTVLEDVVQGGLELPAGSYELVFALSGLMGGKASAEAFEVSTEEAA